METAVVYTRKGDVHSFETGAAGLQTLTVDYTGVPAEERHGLAKQLLASSALACYGGMLSALLEVRKAHVAAITGKAFVDVGPNANGQGRVTTIRLEFRVDLPEAERALFERCAKIMQSGCLVTSSLHEGIAMSYDLDANFTD